MSTRHNAKILIHINTIFLRIPTSKYRSMRVCYHWRVKLAGYISNFLWYLAASTLQVCSNIARFGRSELRVIDCDAIIDRNLVCCGVPWIISTQSPGCGCIGLTYRVEESFGYSKPDRMSSLSFWRPQSHMWKIDAVVSCWRTLLYLNISQR
jgi:hypothetical protein